MLLSDCLNKFINYQLFKNNSKNTISDYSIIIKKFIDFVNNKDSFELSADDVNNYNLYMRDFVSNTSVRTYIRHIRVFINYLISQNLCNNIYNDIIVPRSDKVIVDILQPDEIKKLLSCFCNNDFYSIRNKCMIMLMLDCGLRASEVVNLKYTSINYDSGYIKVMGKGSKERIVPFGNSVALAFSDYNKVRLCNFPLYFYNLYTLSLNGSCGALTTNVFKKMFNKLRTDTGIFRLHPHLLRHTYATNYLLYSTGDIFQLAMLLGHSSTKTTEIYLHIANYYRFMQTKNTYSFLDSEFKK